MPLHLIKERSNGPVLVQRRFRKLPSISKHALVQQLHFETDKLSPPHGIWDLRVENMLAGESVEDATYLRGHRYLVCALGEPVAGAEIMWNIHGPGKHYVAVNIGHFIGATARALEHIATLNEVQTGVFEARALRCRPLYLFAIWLKSENAGEDLIYPLTNGSPPPLEAEKLYPMIDFESTIRSLIQTQFV